MDAVSKNLNLFVMVKVILKLDSYFGVRPATVFLPTKQLNLTNFSQNRHLRLL